MRMRHLIVALVVFGGCSVFANHVSGVKATLQSANPGTGEVMIDMTQYTRYGSSGQRGENDRPDRGLGFNGPGILWGDGASSTSVTLSYVSGGPPFIFRSSFAHTYPDTSNRTITVISECCAGYSSTASVSSGNVYSSSTYNGYYYINSLSNTLAVVFGQQVPTLGQWGLGIFAGLLGAAGMWMIRRRA